MTKKLDDAFARYRAKSEAAKQALTADELRHQQEAAQQKAQRDNEAAIASRAFNIIHSFIVSARKDSTTPKVYSVSNGGSEAFGVYVQSSQNFGIELSTGGHSGRQTLNFSAQDGTMTAAISLDASAATLGPFERALTSTPISSVSEEWVEEAVVAWLDARDSEI